MPKPWAATARASNARIKISTGSVPEKLEPVYIHRQLRTLAEMLTQVLLDSNDHIANQVSLGIGAQRLGAPVDLEKSLQVANAMLAAHGLAEVIHLEEGPGISSPSKPGPVQESL